jgi:hypothetical protein
MGPSFLASRICSKLREQPRKALEKENIVPTVEEAIDLL